MLWYYGWVLKSKEERKMGARVGLRSWGGFLCAMVAAVGLLSGCGGGGDDVQEDWELFDSQAQVELPVDVGWVGAGVGGVQEGSLSAMLEGGYALIVVNHEGVPGTYGEAAKKTREDCERVLARRVGCVVVTSEKDGEGAALGKVLLSIDRGVVLCDVKGYSGGTLQVVLDGCILQARKVEALREQARRRI